MLLLFGQELLSLARPPCLISGTSDLLIDHFPEVQLYKHHLPGMQVGSRKGVNRYEVEPAAMGPWELKSNRLPSKQLKAVSRSSPQEKPYSFHCDSNITKVYIYLNPSLHHL